MVANKHSRLSLFIIFPILLSSLLINGHTSFCFANPVNLADPNFENEHSRPSPQYLPDLCNIEAQILDLERDGKELPIIRLENSRFPPDRERHFLSKLKNKKSQRVILLDVGDYVVKSNGGGGGGGGGGPIMAVDVPAPRTPVGNGVGGILRNSG
ncbi:unnamed protein product [Orchesella dallaii]|uniref:Uncharacterized protein n=1 Tax=Orchesella dallaii TaxID=48710 RepID=A0ABP1QC10_9HEXA